MPRTDRLFDILLILRDGQLQRAQDIAARVGVSPRTIYRDMDTLVASGVPVEGTRGEGYRITQAITLPPLTLTPAELEALNLGLAIAGEAADTDLKAAALSLADKIDAVLPERSVAAADAWKFAVYPFGDISRGIRHMPMLRAAIRARQKLLLVAADREGRVTTRRVRPLLMESLGRIWTLTVWCEDREAFEVLRIDLIERAEALPELFADEPGKTLAELTP